ncbi:MAG: galactokinase [Oscillospiraceae bacterium]|nr:galactokinase [Oscillospiraceae bacterium]
MDKVYELKQDIIQNLFDEKLRELYGGNLLKQRIRYLDALSEFGKLFGSDRDVYVISSPGRCEISGNHTDHQNGCVLAAAVTVDILAIAAANNDNLITLHSVGYPCETIDISDLSIKPEEANSSRALVRGIASYFQQNGYMIGGLDIYMVSDVPKGSGLSSSACFEIAIATVLNSVYNGEKIAPIDIAKSAKHAENVYFMKPSGFMDQSTCAFGGIVSIDFIDVDNPKIIPVDSSIMENDYTVVVVNTGDSHSDLTNMYASITNEMKQVSGYFGKKLLREVDELEFYNSIPVLRGVVSDRALLRAHHFFSENNRVHLQIEALINRDMSSFVELTRESGRSSSVYLQNIYPDNNTNERAIPLALAMSERILKNKGNANAFYFFIADDESAF